MNEKQRRSSATLSAHHRLLQTAIGPNLQQVQNVSQIETTLLHGSSRCLIPIPEMFLTSSFREFDYFTTNHCRFMTCLTLCLFPSTPGVYAHAMAIWGIGWQTKGSNGFQLPDFFTHGTGIWFLAAQDFAGLQSLQPIFTLPHHAMVPAWEAMMCGWGIRTFKLFLLPKTMWNRHRALLPAKPHCFSIYAHITYLHICSGIDYKSYDVIVCRQTNARVWRCVWGVCIWVTYVLCACMHTYKYIYAHVPTVVQHMSLVLSRNSEHPGVVKACLGKWMCIGWSSHFCAWPCHTWNHQMEVFENWGTQNHPSHFILVLKCIESHGDLGISHLKKEPKIRTGSSLTMFFSAGAPSVTGSASAPLDAARCASNATAEMLHQVALRRKMPRVPKSSRALLKSSKNGWFNQQKWW